jgi:hypothetical protein
MRSFKYRSLAALASPLLALSLLGATATPAPAATAPQAGVPFNYWIDATTTLAKLHQTVTIPRGTFAGSINLSTKTLTGHITLPPATATVSGAGLPLATATFKISEVKPVHGTIDFATLTATATSVFNIQVVSLSPAALPFVNLVGDSCMTSKPVSVTMTGSLVALVFSGKYAIPPLQNCGAVTSALNLVIPGRGNTFSATATPKT